MADQALRDEFRPIAVRASDDAFGMTAFLLRRIIDLQLHTIILGIRGRLRIMRGHVLDVGCGEMPYRHLLDPSIRYQGIDVAQANDFGMAPKQDVLPFDGVNIPLPDASIDNVLCTEVLEHATEPTALISEMRRVLKPGGTLVATVPFSARVHYRPYDFHRFTSHRLETMFAEFEVVKIEPRGNDICVISNKLTVLMVRTLKSPLKTVALLPLMLVMLPVTVLFLALAHASIWLGKGSIDDPLGYLIEARR